MYICVCKGITQSDLESAAENGMSYADVRKETGAGTDCGSCAQCIKGIIKQNQASQSAFNFNLAKAI